MIKTASQNGGRAKQKPKRGADSGLGFHHRQRVRGALYRFLFGLGASSEDIALVFASPITPRQVLQRLASLPAEHVNAASLRSQPYRAWIASQLEARA